MGKFLFTLLLFILFILGGLYFASPFILANVLEKAVGAPVSVGGVHLGILSSEIGISNVKVRNPRAYHFKEKELASIPEVYVQMDLKALLNRLIHIEFIRFRIDQITVEKNSQGEVNLLKLAVFKDAASRGTDTTPPQTESTGKKTFKTQIDQVHFSISKVVYVEASPSGVPQVQQMNVNLQNETVHNVTNPREVTLDILQIVLKQVGMNVLQSQISGALSQSLQRDAAGALNGLRQNLPF